MKDKYGEVVVGCSFALRVLIVWRIFNAGLVSEFEVDVGVVAMLAGIAAGRFGILRVVAGVVANVMIGAVLCCGWEYWNSFFCAWMFAAGLHVGEEVFKPGALFGAGQGCGCLLGILGMWGSEVWGSFTIEVFGLLALSLVQIGIYCINRKAKENRVKNTLSQYYSAYPPQSLSAYIVFMCYSLFFMYYTSLLIQFLRTPAGVYYLLLYFSANALFALSTFVISCIFPIVYKKQAKEVLVISLVVQSSIIAIQTVSDTGFQASFIFIHFLWNAINEFDSYVYGENKHICHYWTTSSALAGSIYCLVSYLLPSQLQVFYYFCGVLTLVVFLMFVVGYKNMHPHPSFLPFIYGVEDFALYHDCPYTVRKQVKEELLMKLG